LPKRIAIGRNPPVSIRIGDDGDDAVIFV
jgi:hypothetical protein